MGRECTDAEHYGDLEIECDVRAQRAELRAEHLSWGIMLLVLLLALVGLLGAGPLAHTSARAGDVHVAYDRLQRLQVRQQLDLRLPPTSGQTRLTLQQRFLDRIDLEQVLPAPDTVEAAGGDVTYVYPPADTPRQLLISMTYYPMRAGPLGMTLRVNGGPALPLRSFVLP